MISLSAMLPTNLLSNTTCLPSVAHAAAGWLVLGQTGGNNSQSGQSRPVSLQQGFDIIVSLGWLVAAILLLIIAAFVLRKWLLRDDATGAGVQFTMADLRQMRDQGLMSPEEFDRAKMFLVSRGKALIENNDKDDALTQKNKKPVGDVADADDSGDSAHNKTGEPAEGSADQHRDQHRDQTSDPSGNGPGDGPADPNKNPQG